MKIYTLIECLDKDDYEENSPETILRGVYSTLEEATNTGLNLIRQIWSNYEFDDSYLSVKYISNGGSLVAILKDIECERFHIIETELENHKTIEGERVLKRDKDGRPIVGIYPWES